MFEKRGKTGYAQLVVGATHRVAPAGKIPADLHPSPKGVLSSPMHGGGREGAEVYKRRIPDWQSG